MFDAVIFDLDGTLIDSAPDIHAAANKAITAHGFDPISAALAQSYVGRGVATFVERFRADHGIDDGFQTPLVETFLHHYETAHDLTHPYPGVLTCLSGIVARKQGLGLCTNKPIVPTRTVLTHFGWDFFSVVIGGDSLPQRKPDPAPLMQCITALNARAPLYVGDSEVDAETAARAGVPFALYTEGYRKTPVSELPHDMAFDHFDALTNWLQHP